MKTTEQSITRIFSETRKHIARNRWLSVASVIVIALTFMIASTFAAIVIVSNRTIQSLEQKAQIIIFFENEATEEEIFEIRDTFNETGLLESIEYISKEEALEIYKQDFEDDPTLVESITAEALPPSLGLRAKDIDNIPEIIELATDLKESNSSIEEIMYFKDVIDSLRSISRVIRIGGAALVGAMAIISIVLILITIGFNINAHEKEIEVMQLVGSTDSYIRTPFLLEGAIYGTVGAGLAVGILLLLWYSTIYLLRQGDMYFFVSQTFTDIDMPYLKELDLIFISIVSLASLGIGALVGLLSSWLATKKYLK